MSLKKLEACAQVASILGGVVSLSVAASGGEWSIDVFTRSGKIAGTSGTSLETAIDDLFDALSKKAKEMHAVTAQFEASENRPGRRQP